jgi:hypothetical protein
MSVIPEICSAVGSFAAVPDVAGKGSSISNISYKYLEGLTRGRGRTSVIHVRKEPFHRRISAAVAGR